MTRADAAPLASLLRPGVPGDPKRLALARPFLVAFILCLFPHFLGSVVNITYNYLQIKPPGVLFSLIVVSYNLLAYPVCGWLFFCEWLMVYRVWRHMGTRAGEGGPGLLPSAADVDGARRRALGLPNWAAVLSAVGWLPGGVLFPLLLHAFGDSPPYHKYIFSFTISGLIALTYSVLGVYVVVVRVLYPELWMGGRDLRATARAELAPVDGRLALLQFLSVLIPMAGMALHLGVQPGEQTLGMRLLVAALMAVGTVGLWITIQTARNLRQVIDAMTGRGDR